MVIAASHDVQFTTTMSPTLLRAEIIIIKKYIKNKKRKIIIIIIEDTRETTFLSQRISINSVALQRENAVSFHNTMVRE